MFAPVYECPTCGDVWKGVELVEIIDAERDEVWQEPMCSCGMPVRPKMHDGKPVWHGLTEDEIKDELEEEWYNETFVEDDDFIDDW